MQTLKQNALPCSSPEEQGLPSDAVLAFVRAVEDRVFDMHSFMLLRNGVVVAEGWWNPYGPQYPHILFSLTKSFTGTAVGLLAEEGHISLDDPVVSFFPDEAPEEISENLGQMRVRQLLNMTSGHQEDTTERIYAAGEDWVRQFLALPVEHKPGTHFLYNTGASCMLAAIVQKVTGQMVEEYLQPRLFEPLGIENPIWGIDPGGINFGGFGLSVRTEDIARFGQLYLQKGMWNGRRILPEGWVEQATAKQTSNGSIPESDWDQGYSFQFWRCRHNAYRGDGAFGQYCIVMPEQNAVLAITSGLSKMQEVLNIIWEILLPAMTPARLQDNPAGYETLRCKLDSLAILPPEGAEASPIEAQISGKTFTAAENELGIESFTFDFTPREIFFTVKKEHGESELLFDRGRIWRGSKTDMFAGDEWITPVASVANNAIWQDEQTLVITVRMYETPFYYTLTCCFEGDQASIEGRINVSFGDTKMPILQGAMQ
jgi:CubicO group peptidase (beta-lactamase class C family)